MAIILIIAAIAFVIILLWQTLRAEKKPPDMLVAYTGTIKTGKTMMAVKGATAAYKKQNLKHKLRWLPFFKYFCPESKNPAELYSNIPIYINTKSFVLPWTWFKRKPMKLISKPLTKEHLIMIDVLPEYAIVVIDEIGKFLSQWEYDNPEVMEQVESLFKFFGHFIAGRIFITEQTIDAIVKPIRARLGRAYYLYGFHRFMKILPFFKVTCIPILMLDADKSATTMEVEAEEKYFFGGMPYKWQKKKTYDPRCYSPLYTEDAVKKITAFNGYKTKYLIDLSVNETIRKDYKLNKQKYKDYMYDKKTYRTRIKLLDKLEAEKQAKEAEKAERRAKTMLGKDDL